MVVAAVVVLMEAKAVVDTAVVAMAVVAMAVEVTVVVVEVAMAVENVEEATEGGASTSVSSSPLHTQCLNHSLGRGQLHQRRSCPGRSTPR